MNPQKLANPQKSAGETPEVCFCTNWTYLNMFLGLEFPKKILVVLPEEAESGAKHPSAHETPDWPPNPVPRQHATYGRTLTTYRQHDIYARTNFRTVCLVWRTLFGVLGAAWRPTQGLYRCVNLAKPKNPWEKLRMTIFELLSPLRT